MTKCLSKRVENILPNIIHANQYGFVKGRTIDEAIRMINDTVHCANKNNIQGCLVLLDLLGLHDRNTQKNATLGYIISNRWNYAIQI